MIERLFVDRLFFNPLLVLCLVINGVQAKFEAFCGGASSRPCGAVSP